MFRTDQLHSEERRAYIRELIQKEALTVQQISQYLCGVQKPGFDVGVKTIQRDLDLLDAVKQEYIPNTNPPRKKRAPTYTCEDVPDDTKPSDQAFIEYVALRFLVDRSPTKEPIYVDTLKTLHKGLPKFLQTRANLDIAGLKSQSQGSPTRLTQLLKAWFELKRVRIGYAKMGSGQESKLLEIYHIYISPLNQRLYIIARDVKKDAIRTYRLERIGGVDILDDSYAISDAWDAKKFLANAWGVLGSNGKQPVVVKLRFRDHLFDTVLQESPVDMSAYNTVRNRFEDTFTIEIPVAVDDNNLPLEIMAYIRGWGPKVEVLEPENLRQRWLEDARGIVAMDDTK